MNTWRRVLPSKEKKQTNNKLVDRYQISVITQKFLFVKRENEKKRRKDICYTKKKKLVFDFLVLLW